MKPKDLDSDARVLRPVAAQDGQRAAWQKPTLRRLSAASAEVSAGVANTDGHFTFS
jgi:hypothetical protein